MRKIKPEEVACLHLSRLLRRATWYAHCFDLDENEPSPSSTARDFQVLWTNPEAQQGKTYAESAESIFAESFGVAKPKKREGLHRYEIQMCQHLADFIYEHNIEHRLGAFEAHWPDGWKGSVAHFKGRNESAEPNQ